MPVALPEIHFPPVTARNSVRGSGSLTYALIWRLISREISAGGSVEEVCQCRSISPSSSIVSGRQDLTHRRAPFPILVSRSVCLATTKGQFPGRGRGNCVVVLSGTQGGRRTTFRRRGTKSEGGARQENSENVGFHKGTITIVKAEEGARQRASVGYLGGPTAKFSPPLLEYIIPPPPFA